MNRELPAIPASLRPAGGEPNKPNDCKHRRDDEQPLDGEADPEEDSRQEKDEDESKRRPLLLVRLRRIRYPRVERAKHCVDGDPVRNRRLSTYLVWARRPAFPSAQPGYLMGWFVEKEGFLREYETDALAQR